MADELLNATYDKTYRAASYKAYPSPRALDEALKLGDGFSCYGSITGIYLGAGEHVVFVGNTRGKRLSLLIPDWMRKPAEGINPAKDPNGWGLRKQEIRLQEGVNLIRVEKGGNVHVSYFDDHAETAPGVSVHFPTGKMNGFFDVTKHTNADWNRLLDDAASPIMDARGKHIQVAYPVEWFNVYTHGKGVELINYYDALLHSHYALLGLAKYKTVPKTRILARVNFNYYMFRDRDGVAYFGNKETITYGGRSKGSDCRRAVLGFLPRGGARATVAPADNLGRHDGSELQHLLDVRDRLQTLSYVVVWVYCLLPLV